MAEAWLSMVEKVTEFFSTEQIEASARRTNFVQRASKITGKLFLALVTLGRWSNGHPSVAQLAAKAAQLDHPVTVTPSLPPSPTCISRTVPALACLRVSPSSFRGRGAVAAKPGQRFN